VSVVDRRPGFFWGWRADGWRIAFDFFEPDEDICITHPDGPHLVHLTNTPQRSENWPSWGPLANH
jgi:hypothetical protein